MQTTSITPNDWESRDLKFESCTVAALLLDLILSRNDLNGLDGLVHEVTIHPVYMPRGCYDLLELEYQMQKSMNVGQYVAFGLMNQKDLLDDLLTNVDSCLKSRVYTLLDLCQNKHSSFVNRVMTHWRTNRAIWKIDIIRYFEEDWGPID